MSIELGQALIAFTAGGTGLGVLIFLVISFLSHLTKKDEVFTGVVSEISQRNIEHHNRLAAEASERSQAIQSCIKDNNLIIGRACATLDRHDDILKVYEAQSKTRTET